MLRWRYLEVHLTLGEVAPQLTRLAHRHGEHLAGPLTEQRVAGWEDRPVFITVLVPI